MHWNMIQANTNEMWSDGQCGCNIVSFKNDQMQYNIKRWCVILQQCNTKWWNTVQCNSKCCNAMQCTTRHFNAKWWSVPYLRLWNAHGNIFSYNTIQINAIKYPGITIVVFGAALRTLECIAINFHTTQCNAIESTGIKKNSLVLQ